MSLDTWRLEHHMCYKPSKARRNNTWIFNCVIHIKAHKRTNMLHILINVELFDKVRMQVACKSDKVSNRFLGLGKLSLIATTQRRWLDIAHAINFAHEVSVTKILSINLNFLERPLKIYKFHQPPSITLLTSIIHPLFATWFN